LHLTCYLPPVANVTLHILLSVAHYPSWTLPGTKIYTLRSSVAPRPFHPLTPLKPPGYYM